MTQINALSASQLNSFNDLADFHFNTTDDFPDFDGMLGQERAKEALSFGIGIQHPGYNMYLMGSSGLGKHTLLNRFLEKASAEQPVANDWCYIYNFEDPQKPKSLSLPAGQARLYRNDLQQLVADLQSAIPSAFETEQYYVRLQELRDNLQKKIRKAFDALTEEASRNNVIIFREAEDFTFLASRDNKSLSPQEYETLPEKERSQFEQVIAGLEDDLRNLFQQRSLWQKETRKRINEINREVGMFASSDLINEVKARYKSFTEIVQYMDDIQQDIINNLFEFSDLTHQGLNDDFISNIPNLDHYDINIVVDNRDTTGAPVVYEDNPVYQNILGQVEYVSEMGNLITDFRFIKSGALHKANGGYLILDAHKLLNQPLAWDALKRALVAKEINIQSLAEVFGLVSTVSLEPMAIPLDIKIILVGERSLYYSLQEMDSDFSELFKVEVDFSESVKYSKESLQQYVQLIATIARKKALLALQRDAVLRIIEYSMRQIEDTTHLSTHMHSMTDLLIEADYWAKQTQQKVIRRVDVQTAIDKQVYRADRSRENIYDEINKGTLLIDISGERIATVNGLFIIEMGRLEFAQPARITATVRIGEGDIIDIEREVELGGAIHSKGVLILTAYLGSHYATKKPLSLSASLVFEQSYGSVDGDSATVGELCALLSAISNVPIKQSFAITGSANQHGHIQAIGGVNEKIEGFFDICNQQGLTGEQGVIIPAANIPHLILKEDVVTAVEKQLFTIYPINTVDQAISILTGLDAGERNEKGDFPEATINYLVEHHLLEMAELKNDDHNKDDHEHHSTG